MGVQEIGRSGKSGKEQIQEYPGRKMKECPERFQESLMQNLKYQGQEQEGREKAGNDRQAMMTGRVGAPGIRVSTAVRWEAIQTAEVRHMSYEESDNIRIAVTEGYILKGKLEGSRVYVEAKYDDGRLEAYQVDTDRVQAQTKHRIEQFAVETAAGMVNSGSDDGKE